MNTPLRRTKAVFRRVNDNTPVNQWQTVAVGKVVHHITGFRVIDTTYDQISVSSEAIGAIVAYGQRNGPNNRPRRSRDPANASSNKVHLSKAHRRTVGIGKPVKIVQSNIVRVDDGYLFDACPSKGLENHGPDAPGTHHADVSTGKTRLSREAPTI